MKAQLLAENYENIRTAGAALYQMKPCHNIQMMGYVIRTRNGHLFLIDGGMVYETEEFLRLARKASGTPEGTPVHIDGWFLSHAHCDHIDAFKKTVREYWDTVRVDRIFYNFPETSYEEAYEPGDAYTSRDFYELEPRFHDRTTVVHTGDRIVYDDVTFDILHEPDTSVHDNPANNCSIVIRMTLEGQTVLFLGDLGVEGGKRLLADYGKEALRSDFCELAHHGQSGVTFDVYEAVCPRAALWCTPEWLWRNDPGQGYGSGFWQTFAVRCLMQDLGVQYNFVEKDGIWEIPFPFDFKDGPDKR